MIRIYKASELGHFQNEWLNSRHHFSFGEYHNPERVHFGRLRVINDDLILAGNGFDFHPHENMEIITYVREGAILHRDSLGNEGRTEAGSVQVMSAGTGIMHSEFADEQEDTKIFQIWIFPREKGVKPRWEQAAFSNDPVSDSLNLLVSGRKDDQDKGALMIHQDAALYAGRLPDGVTLTHKVQGQAYVLVADGRVMLNGEAMESGDGAEVRKEETIEFSGGQDATVLVIEVEETVKKEKPTGQDDTEKKSAPKRQAYDENNIFAKILRGEIPCDRVFENEHVLAFRDIAPQAPVHILVIPKGQYVSVDDFAARASTEELTAFYRSIVEIAHEQGLVDTGFRVISNSGHDGGQEVPHFHMHILGGRQLGPMLRQKNRD